MTDETKETCEAGQCEVVEEEHITFHPLHDTVAVRPVKRVKLASSSKIITPEMATSLMPISEIVAVGPGRLLPDGNLHPCSVKPGDLVVLRDCPPECSANGEQIGLCPETNILTRLEGVDRSTLKFGTSWDDKAVLANRAAAESGGGQVVKPPHGWRPGKGRRN